MKSNRPRLSPSPQPVRQGPPTRKQGIPIQLTKGLAICTLIAFVLAGIGLGIIAWLSKRRIPANPQPAWYEKGHQEAYWPQNLASFMPIWPPDHTVGVSLPRRPLQAVHERLKASQADQVRPLAGLTVILDAGHGGQDPGAVAVTGPKSTDHGETLNSAGEPDTNYQEKTAALKLSQAIADQLRQAGATVHETRTADHFVSIYARAAQSAQVVLDRFQNEMSQWHWPKPKGSAAAAGHHEPAAPAQERVEALVESVQAELTAVQSINRDQRGGFLGTLGAPWQTQWLYNLERQFPDIVFLSIHLNSAADPAAQGARFFITRNALIYQHQNVEGLDLAPSPYGWQQPQEEADSQQPHEEADRQQPTLAYPLYLNYDEEARSALAQALATALKQHQPQLADQAIPTPVIDGNYAVLRACNLPSVLIETGFITNEADRTYLFGSQAPAAWGQTVQAALVQYKAWLIQQLATLETSRE